MIHAMLYSTGSHPIPPTFQTISCTICPNSWSLCHAPRTYFAYATTFWVIPQNEEKHRKILNSKTTFIIRLNMIKQWKPPQPAHLAPTPAFWHLYRTVDELRVLPVSQAGVGLCVYCHPSTSGPAGLAGLNFLNTLPTSISAEIASNLVDGCNRAIIGGLRKFPEGPRKPFLLPKHLVHLEALLLKAPPTQTSETAGLILAWHGSWRLKVWCQNQTLLALTSIVRCWLWHAFGGPKKNKTRGPWNAWCCIHCVNKPGLYFGEIMMDDVCLAEFNHNCCNTVVLKRFSTLEARHTNP